MNGFNAVKEARTCHSFTTGCPIEYPFSHLIWPDSRKLRELVMGKIVFVPLSDEMIYEHPELITGPIGAFAPQRVDFPDPGAPIIIIKIGGAPVSGFFDITS